MAKVIGRLVPNILPRDIFRNPKLGTNNFSITEVDADPSIDGLDSAIGSISVFNDNGVAKYFYKVGAGAFDWERDIPISTTEDIEHLNFQSFDNSNYIHRTLYVNDSTGDDDINSGDITSPYKTIERALRNIPKCSPFGYYIIRVAAGTYVLPATLPGIGSGVRIICETSVSNVYSVDSVLRGNTGDLFVDGIQGAVVKLSGANFTPGTLRGTLIKIPSRFMLSDLGVDAMYAIIDDNTADTITFEVSDVVTTTLGISAGTQIEFLNRDVNFVTSSTDQQGNSVFSFAEINGSIKSSIIEFAKFSFVNFNISSQIRFRYCYISLFTNIYPGANAFFDCCSVIGNITIYGGARAMVGYGTLVYGGGVYGGVLIQSGGILNQFGPWRVSDCGPTTSGVNSIGGTYDSSQPFYGAYATNNVYRPLCYSPLTDNLTGAPSGNHSVGQIMGAWQADNSTYKTFTDTYLCRVSNGTRVKIKSPNYYTYTGGEIRNPSADGGITACSTSSDGTRVDGAYLKAGPQTTFLRTISGSGSILSTDEIIKANNLSSNVILTLPLASTITKGSRFTVEVIYPLYNYDVIISPTSTDTILGFQGNYSSKSYSSGLCTLYITSDGQSNWHISNSAENIQINTNGLVQWVEADFGIIHSSNIVSQITDRSFYGLHYKQSSLGSAPVLTTVLGKPAIVTSGGKTMYTDDSINASISSNGITVYSVFSTTESSIPSDARGISGCWGPTSFSWIQAATYNSVDSPAFLTYNSVGSLQYSTSPGKGNDGKIHLVVGRADRNGLTLNSQRDLAYSKTTTITSGFSPSASQKIYLGAYGAGNSGSSDIAFFAQIIYNYCVEPGSDTDVKVRKYLSKWVDGIEHGGVRTIDYDSSLNPLSDSVITINNSTNKNFTLPLANSVPAGRLYTIKATQDVDVSHDIILVVSGSDLVEGVTPSYSFNTSGLLGKSAIDIYSDGQSNWWIK